MHLASRLVLGGGIVSVGTIGALLTGGVLATTTTLVITDPLAPAASADSLRRFDSCSDLLDWYVDHGVEEVGPYGWGAGPVTYAADGLVGRRQMELDATVPQAAADSAATTDVRANGPTGTNTQEDDVDEPDLAKTDGRRVVRVVDQRTVVVSDVTGPAPREVGRLPLPVDVYGGELLLAGDHVLVSQAGRWGDGSKPFVADDVVDGEGIGPDAGTRIIDVDLSDAEHPRIVHDDSYSGALVSMRLYGDTVRLVTTTSRPQLAWVFPHARRIGRRAEDEATRQNRELVRATTIEDWLPTVVDNLVPRSASPLLDCTDVYHPGEWSGGETTAITTYDVSDPAHRRSVGVTTDGQVVYSSAERLYVGSTEIDEPRRWRRMSGSSAARVPMPFRPRGATTQLHAFALDGEDTRYIGSGHVDGSVRDRWSLDEHGGKLRVAWTRDGSGTIADGSGETRQHIRNGITILSERDGALVRTGEIAGLGIDENIQSVRWYDDLAVLVTFRQMDPLYMIDLTDQDHPREAGELEVAGYSGYLHPIGGDLLLGLGVDATGQGRSLGAQAAVFDLADLTAPERVSRQGFSLRTSMPALDDPRGFTWLPDRRIGLTTVATWTGSRSRLVALHVDERGALDAYDVATDVGWNARTLPLEDGRVALVDNSGLRVLDLG